MEKIKDFIYIKDDPDLNIEENLHIINRSNSKNIIHQSIFQSIDEFAKRVIKDIHNANSANLFNSNHLNIVADEDTIELLIGESLKSQEKKFKALTNPEMIYRAFNFIKPVNLLPNYNVKLFLIKQIGISESGKEKNYVINPYFFGYKISLDIFIHSLFCSDYSADLEKGLVQILNDKYGSEYVDIYKYVQYVAAKSVNEGKLKGDKNDETFISGIQKISGIYDKKVFYNFVYESGMLTAQSMEELLKGK